ncbi:hypothetical protein GOP47_0011531 [Adiantum capillus-veneris]|uniref:DNA topoisomerase I eukaryotic-type domain-containing protein n=1 Tax=Adiantum capillus-veneris TaxID=13818 RepID=A0A9D4UUD3_ADICA|nr:hypothetical protein GOP47_0011531 [Adiantum capillus-veneris]
MNFWWFYSGLEKKNSSKPQKQPLSTHGNTLSKGKSPAVGSSGQALEGGVRLPAIATHSKSFTKLSPNDSGNPLTSRPSVLSTKKFTSQDTDSEDFKQLCFFKRPSLSVSVQPKDLFKNGIVLKKLATEIPRNGFGNAREQSSQQCSDNEPLASRPANGPSKSHEIIVSPKDYGSKKRPFDEKSKHDSAGKKPKLISKPSSPTGYSESFSCTPKPPFAGGGQKWTTLKHNGVLFPPPYSPHGIKILYEKKPVTLAPAQEEVATMFAAMRESDYMTKPTFLSNFWNDWRMILGPGHVIQNLEGCDFTPIYEWHLAEEVKKKRMTLEERKRIIEEKQKQEEKYMWALVDGVKEKVGNFRVEPPGLFRGRGEHPKMGKLKQRIFPEDIVINIGKDAPIPDCPMEGHRWKEIRNDNTARTLNDYIEDIRNYTKKFTSTYKTKMHIAVATFLIDQLALRDWNEVVYS